jgi:predicted N-formylglutamate amidohydrolase
MSGQIAIGHDDIERLASGSFDEINGSSDNPCLLIAEHAGAEIPQAWSRLGLDEAMMSTHYAVDIGIDALTRRLADDLNAHALLARYSRIFLDFNRLDGDWDCMRPDLGGIPVPGNRGIATADRQRRLEIARQPLDSALSAAVKRRPLLISLHSFTPVMGGVERPVDIGVLWKKPSPLVDALLGQLEAGAPDHGFLIGDNAPYDWRTVTAYTLEYHGLDKGRDCLYLEVRNDLLQSDGTFNRVSTLLADVIGSVISSLEAETSQSGA